jgi:hypothetical protein
VSDLNPTLDGLDDYDLGFDSGSDDDLDLSISSFFPSNDPVVPTVDSSRCPSNQKLQIWVTDTYL